MSEESIRVLRRTLRPNEAIRLTGPGRVVIEDIPDHRAAIRVEAPASTQIIQEPA